MSTKLEDLPDSDIESSIGEVQEVESKPKVNEAFKIVFDGVKRPLLVSFLMFILAHPFLLSGIEKIPNIEYFTGRISIHLLLSIIAGVLFFLIDKLN